MELAVRPDDLYAASVVLAGCSAQLDDAALAFGRQAQADVPEVGAKAAVAVERGVEAAERAIQVISRDIERLADALAALAHAYPRVDASAVRHR